MPCWESKRGITKEHQIENARVVSLRIVACWGLNTIDGHDPYFDSAAERIGSPRRHHAHGLGTGYTQAYSPTHYRATNAEGTVGL